MGVYEEFLERKSKGEKLEFGALTRDELKQMWYDEVKFAVHNSTGNPSKRGVLVL